MRGLLGSRPGLLVIRAILFRLRIIVLGRLTFRILVIIIPVVIISIVIASISLLGTSLLSVAPLLLIIVFTSLSMVITALLVVVGRASVPITSVLLLSSLPFDFLARISLFFNLGLISVVLAGGQVGILFKFLLILKEVYLHLLVRIGQVILALDADHLIQGLSLVFVVDLEHDANFFLPLPRVILDRNHVDTLGRKTRQKVHSFGAYLTSVCLLIASVLPIASLEKMDLEAERCLLLLNHLAEESRVVLIIQPIVGLWVDLVHVKFFVSRSIFTIVCIVIITATISSISTPIIAIVIIAITIATVSIAAITALFTVLLSWAILIIVSSTTLSALVIISISSAAISITISTVLVSAMHLILIFLFSIITTSIVSRVRWPMLIIFD